MTSLFNEEWEALPEIYKEKFTETLRERGMLDEFKSLPDDQKAQILAIITGYLNEIIDENESTTNVDPTVSDT